MPRIRVVIELEPRAIANLLLSSSAGELTLRPGQTAEAMLLPGERLQLTVGPELAAADSAGGESRSSPA